MKRLAIMLWTLLAGAVFAVPSAGPEAYLDAARRIYPTAAWTAGTNTLVTAYAAVGPDCADRPTPGGCVRWHYVEGMRNVRDLGGWNGLPTGRIVRVRSLICWRGSVAWTRSISRSTMSSRALREYSACVAETTLLGFRSLSRS